MTTAWISAAAGHQDIQTHFITHTQADGNAEAHTLGAALWVR